MAPFPVLFDQMAMLGYVISSNDPVDGSYLISPWSRFRCHQEQTIYVRRHKRMWLIFTGNKSPSYPTISLIQVINDQNCINQRKIAIYGTPNNVSTVARPNILQ